MAIGAIDFSGLDDLVTGLKATGIRSVSTNPADLNLPGVLVDLAAIRFDLLGGVTLVLRVSLIAPDTGPTRSLGALRDLLTKAGPLLDPEGDAIGVVMSLPEQSAPMPALQLTHEIPSPYL